MRTRQNLFVLCLVVCLLGCLLPVKAGNFYNGTSPANVPWPGGIVPYQFTNTLTPGQSNTFFDGIREWQLAANVQFVPYIGQSRWVLFTYNTNWVDNVSATTNPQVVTVSSLSRGQVCHEMGHSLGFTHENIRYDRTNYLTVLTNNISPPSNLTFFEIDPTSVTNGQYDFQSVMHLGDTFSSAGTNLFTQQALPPYYAKYQNRMGGICLSPGDRAALAYLYPPAAPLTNIVTTTQDHGLGSLRAALYYVTDHPGVPVKFNIPNTDSGYSNGVFTIHLSGYLPPLVTDGMVIDGSTQPGFTSKPLILIDGSQLIPEAYPTNQIQVTGLLIYAANCQVKNLSFQNFDWNGITLEYPFATNDTISGCWLGPDYSGTNAAPNVLQGILIFNGACSNIIGGTTALARNVLSGNGQYGVLITGTNTVGNVVEGNYIGTDASGKLMLSNAVGGVFLADGAVDNTIGGTAAGAGNVISGNVGSGVLLDGTNVAGEVVEGNYIGTDVTGTKPLPNTLSAVTVDFGAFSNLVGGTLASARNVLSGNGQYGVLISATNTVGNVVAGNYIGTDVSGKLMVSNVFGGVFLAAGAADNIIGGTSAGAGNVISGNLGNGVLLQGPNVQGDVVAGNYIGTDFTGTNPLPNVVAGVTIDAAASSNIIGGTVTGARNIISGNDDYSDYGVIVAGPGTSGNLVEGNYVGVGPNGLLMVSNYFGILCSGGATNNIIGGTVPGARNVVSGNMNYGIMVKDVNTSENVVEGNYAGLDASGTVAVPNSVGVIIYNGATNNLIGGTAAGAANYFSGNNSGYAYGVFITDAGTSNNYVEGNYIGTDYTGTNGVPNYDNVVVQNTASGNVIGGVGAGQGNVIAFASGYGVVEYANGTTNNSYRGNSIYADNFYGIDLNGNGVTNPAITNAFGLGFSTVVKGSLSSAPSQNYIIDVYRNLSELYSGTSEGQYYVGSVAVTTSGAGNATFALTNASGNYTGQYFTATATSAQGDTSQFSPDIVATNLPAPGAVFSGSFAYTRANGFSLVLNLVTNFGYHIQGATNLAQNPVTWINLTNFTATNSLYNFIDHTATNFVARFYRVTSP